MHEASQTQSLSPVFKVGGRSITVVISDVARNTDLNIAHVSRIFSGKRVPSYRAAKRISSFLKISLDQLYTILNIQG